MTIIKINNNKIRLSKEDNFHNYFKNYIFSGGIIIFQNFPQILELIDFTEQEIKKIFKVKNLLDIHLPKDPREYKRLNRKFTDLQIQIKNTRHINKLFTDLLLELKFDIKSTFSDKICLRYTGQNKKKLGSLNFAKAHRDTWASNVFEQINWWLPLHKTLGSNTIYICPHYFKKPIENNSNSWKFENYVRNKISYPSTPFTNLVIPRKKKKIINMKKGELLCFSGQHLHGSNEGRSGRFSVETRTVSSHDHINYVIPENLDGNYPLKKINWFKNIISGETLNDFC